MAIRQVRTIGDDILRKECKPVKEITPRIAELIEDMFETMYEANGVGLAAPQVGILKQIVVMDVDDGNQYVLINPEIIEQSGSMQETRANVSEVLKEIEDSMQSILQIRESTGRLAESRGEVMEAVEQLSQIAHDNVDSTQQTYTETQEVLDTFKQVYDSAGQLKKIADELAESMQYFKIQ